MSKHKKKRRASHKRKRRQISPSVRDRHHLCYQKGKWGYGYLRELRDYWYCRISIPRDTLHRAIHCAVNDIPVPKNRSAKDALEQLRSLEKYGAITEFDSIERRLNLLIALFECSDQETADAFKEQLKVVCEYKKTL